jgi:hypothetical protein
VKGPPPEFGSVKGKNSRLWLSIKGEKTCLAALYPELIALEMDVAVEGEMLTAMAPIAANIDQLLSAISAAVDRRLPDRGCRHRSG